MFWTLLGAGALKSGCCTTGGSVFNWYQKHPTRVDPILLPILAATPNPVKEVEENMGRVRDCVGNRRESEGQTGLDGSQVQLQPQGHKTGSAQDVPGRAASVRLGSSDCYEL